MITRVKHLDTAAADAARDGLDTRAAIRLDRRDIAEALVCVSEAMKRDPEAVVSTMLTDLIVDLRWGDER